MAAVRRILFPLMGGDIGGSDFSTLEMTENLPPGYERHIVLHRRGALAAWLDEKHIPYTVLDGLRNTSWRKRKPVWSIGPTTLHSLLWPLWRYVRHQRIDLVHTQTLAMHVSWALPARLAGARFIWHQRTGGRPKSAMRRLADRVICVSEFVRRDMGDAFPPEKIQVLYNPFDPARYTSIDREACRAALLAELGLADPTRLVGFVANVHPRKRPDLFLDTAEVMAKASEQPLAFVIFGRDQDAYGQGLKAHAKQLGITVHWMGFRTPPERNIAALDLHLGCSVDEGYGRAYVETALIGTPLIATLSGSNAEIIDDRETGLLVPPDDPAAMAAAALSLLTDPGRAGRLAAAAQAKMMERHDLRRYMAAIDAVYREVLG